MTNLDQLITALEAARDHHGGSTPVSVHIHTPYDSPEYLDVMERHGPIVTTLEIVCIKREAFEVPDAG